MNRWMGRVTLMMMMRCRFEWASTRDSPMQLRFPTVRLPYGFLVSLLAVDRSVVSDLGVGGRTAEEQRLTQGKSVEQRVRSRGCYALVVLVVQAESGAAPGEPQALDESANARAKGARSTSTTMSSRTARVQRGSALPPPLQNLSPSILTLLYSILLWSSPRHFLVRQSARSARKGMDKARPSDALYVRAR